MRALQFLFLIAIAITVVGCGGSSQTTSHVGSLTLKVKWPVKGRLIPYDSASIVAVLTNSSGASLGTQTLPRPAEGVLTTSVTFTNIATGAVTLTATAYPTAQGTGVAQAVGKAGSTIVAGQTASVTVTMADTIVAINILNAAGGAAGGTLQTGQTQQLTAQCVDASGDTVLTSATTIQWSVPSGFAYGSVSATGLVTMLANGKLAAAFDVVVEETESQVTSLVQFKYTPPTYNTPGFALGDPSGTHLYTLDNGGVHVYNIASGGQLSLAQEVAAPGLNTLAVIQNIGACFTPNGQHLCIYAEGGPYVDAFNVASDGTLTFASNAAAPTNGLNLGMDPTGTYFYASGAGATGAQLNIYTLSSAGILTISSTVTSFTPGVPRYVVNDPGTPYMMGTTTNASSQLELLTMTVNSDGTLKVVQTLPLFTVPAPPEAFTPNGATWYSFLSEIRTAGISPSTGAVTDYGYTNLGNDDEDLDQGVVNPAGTILYVRAYSGGEGLPSDASYITPCTIGTNGALTALPKTATSLPAEVVGSVVISPSGKFLYTSNGQDNSISQFSVNSDGSLTPLVPPKVVG
jgi:hypothetical protein